MLTFGQNKRTRNWFHGVKCAGLFNIPINNTPCICVKQLSIHGGTFRKGITGGLCVVTRTLLKTSMYLHGVQSHYIIKSTLQLHTSSMGKHQVAQCTLLVSSIPDTDLSCWLIWECDVSNFVWRCPGASTVRDTEMWGYVHRQQGDHSLPKPAL